MLYFFIRQKSLNIYTAIWTLYTFVAIFGYVSVKQRLHYSGDPNLGESLSLVPYICLYITTFVLSWPIRKIDVSKIKIDVIHSKIFKYLILLLACVFLAVSLVKIGEVSTIMSIGLGEAYESAHNDGAKLFQYSNPFLKVISSWGMTLCIASQGFLLLYSFSMLIHQEKKKWLYLFFIVLSFIPGICSALSNGSKGGLFFSAWDMIFVYIFFKDSLPYSVKKLLTVVGLFGFAVLISYVVVITSERNSLSKIKANRQESEIETIVRYLGEAMPNLGWNIYERVKKHPNGERFYPELLGDPARGSKLVDEFYYYRQSTGINMALFRTFWGDCYIEFGFWGSFLYIILMVSLWDIFVFSHYRDPIRFPLIYYYYHFFIIWGVFSHGFTGQRTHVCFIYLVLLCVCVKKLSKKRSLRIGSDGKGEV